MNTFEEYFHFVVDAKKNYGEKAVVFIQIGSFYEIYGSWTCEGSEKKLQETIGFLSKSGWSEEQIKTDFIALLGYSEKSLPDELFKQLH